MQSLKEKKSKIITQIMKMILVLALACTSQCLLVLQSSCCGKWQLQINECAWGIQAWDRGRNRGAETSDRGENKALQISDEARPKQSVETEVLRLRPHPKSDWFFCRGTARVAWRCSGYGIGLATLKVVGSTPGLFVSDDNLGLAVHTHTCLCHQSV